MLIAGHSTTTDSEDCLADMLGVVRTEQIETRNADATKLRGVTSGLLIYPLGNSFRTSENMSFRIATPLI